MRTTLLFLAVVGACSRSPEAATPVPEAPPSTDIYLYRFTPPSAAGQVFNITNRSGYDNQPSWDGNGRILYTAQEDGQTEIYQVNFESSAISRIFATPESEYSPTITPDGKAISVVRVELDSTQRLWQLPLDGSGPSVILPDISPVGYFAWLDSTVLALFVLGSPNTLRIADTRTGEATVVATGIGRSLQRVPGGRRASFLHRVGGQWVLKTVDPDVRADGSFRVDSIAVMPPGADYVVWRSATEVYSASGSRLLRLQLPAGTWEEAVDLGGQGIRNISRLALSPDRSRLAFVADEPRAP
ncbi:MAG: hypothetical protein WD801_03350 [Gemmatimonadaceae bacterium]